MPFKHVGVAGDRSEMGRLTGGYTKQSLVVCPVEGPGLCSAVLGGQGMTAEGGCPPVEQLRSEGPPCYRAGLESLGVQPS